MSSSLLLKMVSTCGLWLGTMAKRIWKQKNNSKTNCGNMWNYIARDITPKATLASWYSWACEHLLQEHPPPGLRLLRITLTVRKKLTYIIIDDKLLLLGVCLESHTQNSEVELALLPNVFGHAWWKLIASWRTHDGVLDNMGAVISSFCASCPNNYLITRLVVPLMRPYFALTDDPNQVDQRLLQRSTTSNHCHARLIP